MAQLTYQIGFILSFANRTGQEIPKHRFISYTPESTDPTNIYPTQETGVALGVTVDNIDAKQSINVQRGGIVIVELEELTSLNPGEAIKAGANGLGRAHNGTGTVIAYALDGISSSGEGARIRAVLANA